MRLASSVGEEAGSRGAWGGAGVGRASGGKAGKEVGEEWYRHRHTFAIGAFSERGETSTARGVQSRRAGEKSGFVWTLVFAKAEASGQSSDLISCL